MFKYKTEAELTAMTTEQRDTYGVEKRKFEATQTKAQIDAAMEEVKKLIPAPVAAEVTKAQFAEILETVNQLKEVGTVGSKEMTMLKSVTENADKIKASIEKGGAVHEFVVKANTVAGNVVGNQNALQIDTIGQLATRKLTAYDMFPKMPVPENANGVVRYVDWDDATKIRAAAMILEGGTFPSSLAKWATYTIALQKVGDSIPLSEEFAYDNAMFAAELDSFLQTNVNLIVDTNLINGNGVAPNISGITNQVPAFVPVNSGIPDANIYDLIVKVKESITTLYGSKYSPNFVLMNIADINKMRLKKNSYFTYIQAPFANIDSTAVSGVMVMECNAIAPNTFVLGDSNFAKIYEVPGIYVATGYDGSNWSQDMVTMKARKRLNLLIRTVDQTGFKKVTSISAALVTLTSP